MNRRFVSSIALVLMTIPAVSFADVSEIKLSGKKDFVLSNQVRVQVLALSENLLADPGADFVENLADLDSPFVFEQVEAVVAEVEVEAEEEPVINYDDASILRVVAENFSRQVSGTLGRGRTTYLQLDGGALIRPGASFPVSIPQAQDRTFTVTVSEITGNSYTLNLGAAEQIVRLTGTSGQGGGATRTN